VKEFSPGDTCVHIWKVYTIKCRQTTHQVNAVQHVHRHWKKRHCLSACLCIAPSNAKRLYILLSPVKISSGEAGGTQTTGLSSYCSMWLPAPQIWDPGVVHAASHQGKRRVLKYLAAPWDLRESCVHVCVEGRGVSGSKGREQGYCGQQCRQ